MIITSYFIQFDNSVYLKFKKSLKPFDRLTQGYEELEYLQGKIKRKDQKIDELKEEIRLINNAIERDSMLLSSKEDTREDQIRVRINKETREKEKEIIDLKEKNIELKTRNEILEKAFQNMGFDVKDMKGILDKLVEALVTKNEINIVKSA